MDDLDCPVLDQIIIASSSKPFADGLLADPAAFHSRDSQERTALSWAAASGNRQCVARLPNRGADPNVLDKYNKMPPYLAVEYELDYNFDIVNAFLGAGVDTDPNLPHPKRSTPLLCAPSNVKDLRELYLLLCGGVNVKAA